MSKIKSRRLFVASLVFPLVVMIVTGPAGADGSPTSSTTITTVPPTTSTPTTPPTSNGTPDVTCCGGAGGVYWGFDQLARFTSSSLSSTESADGVPTFVGRYLTYGTSSDELNAPEVSLFQSDNIPLLLLVDPNDIDSTTSEANSDASGAIAEAESLGAEPNQGIALYRDIEEGDPITTAYINQYFTDIENAGYIPGFYEDSYAGSFEGQFCAASSSTRTGTLLYASELHSGSSLKKSLAPTTFNPYYAGCEAFGNVSAWQYLTGAPDVDEGTVTGLWY